MLPPHVKAAFSGVDLILHAGDIYVPALLDELESVAPVLAARGNGDYDFPPDHRVENSHVLDLDGFKLGITHAIVYPESPFCTLEKTMDREFGGHVDIIVFGDTHVALLERYNGTLVVNPGSPTIPNGLFELGTVGLLEIEDGAVKAQIVQLGDLQLAFQRKLIYYPGLGA